MQTIKALENRGITGVCPGIQHTAHKQRTHLYMGVLYLSSSQLIIWALFPINPVLKKHIFIILFWLLKARQRCLRVALAPVGLHTIYGSFICFKSLVATALLHSHNNQLFPCVLLKFPTHFMVALNDLIICPQISKTHFEARDSFPWRPWGGDSIRAASNLGCVIRTKKKGGDGIN